MLLGQLGVPFLQLTQVALASESAVSFSRVDFSFQILRLIYSFKKSQEHRERVIHNVFYYIIFVHAIPVRREVSLQRHDMFFAKRVSPSKIFKWERLGALPTFCNRFHELLSIAVMPLRFWHPLEAIAVLEAT